MLRIPLIDLIVSDSREIGAGAGRQGDHHGRAQHQDHGLQPVLQREYARGAHSFWFLIYLLNGFLLLIYFMALFHGYFS